LPETFVPAYRRLDRRELDRRVEAAEDLLRDCHLCGRGCGVDRTGGEEGFCRTLDRPFVSSWGPHFGEEPPLVGSRGSGTIFFGRCNLGCVFCQNWQISHEGEGAEMGFHALAGVMLELQGLGCHNINLVTPTHQMPMILNSLALAADAGLHLPLVWNCGGYESRESLRALEGLVDIYMPDVKYASGETAAQYSGAPDYPDVAEAALREMHRQVGDLVIDGDGVSRRGLLVRHLVLPGGLAGTGEVMRFLAEEISPDTYVNVMDQYRPCYRASEFPPLNRRITRGEFQEAVRLARAAGLRRLAGITV
jgi:putative pyruvate formate lyase activating enzyme